MIGYLVGLLLVAWVPRLEWIAPAALLIVFILLSGRPLSRRWRGALASALAGVVLGGLWGEDALSHRLPDRLARQEVTLTGVIDDLVLRAEGRQRFSLRVQQVESSDPGFQRLRRLQLSFYDDQLQLGAGDQLRLKLRLFPPQGLHNPHGFDNERRLLMQHIDGRGYVRELLEHHSRHAWWASQRQALADWLERRFAPEAATTLSALVLGARQAMARERWQLMSETGTAHLMVVSGLHIAVMTGAGLLLARLLSVPLLVLGGAPGLARAVPVLLPLTLATGYAWLAGMGLPVQRALLMVAVFLLAEWRLQRVTAWQRWRWALLGVTLLQPLAVVEPGAWLSFGAVALLILLVNRRGAPRSAGAWAGGLGRVQGQLFIGMLPLSVVLFNQVGLLAPLVNLLAVPLISLLVMLLPVALPLASLDNAAGAGLVTLLNGAVELFWHALAQLRNGMGLYAQVPSPPAWALLFAALGIACWCLPLPWRWRWLSLCLLLPLLAARPELPVAGRFKALVFDVGQGLAVLIETAEGRVLYDTGPGYRDGGSVFPYALAPSFRAAGIETLEVAVLSHDDLDHSGGLGPLRAGYNIERLLAGQPERLELPAEHCTGGFRLGQVEFQLFALAQPALADNDRSCVLLVRDQHCSLLLPGDLSQAGERLLLQQAGAQLSQALPGGRLDWLLAGHHGSAGSSSLTWLAVLQPRQVIFSRGAHNAFGHPAAPVLERLALVQAQTFDTARDGALLLHSTPEGCRTDAWRSIKKRYWTAGY